MSEVAQHGAPPRRLIDHGGVDSKDGGQGLAEMPEDGNRTVGDPGAGLGDGGHPIKPRQAGINFRATPLMQ